MPWFDSFDAAAAGRFPGMEVLCGEPMALHTTFRIGGPARRMARPRSTEEAAALLALAEAEGWPVLMLGNGSNLLAADNGRSAPGQGSLWPVWQPLPSGRAWAGWSSPTASPAAWGARCA